jgi:hypothetical protein
MWKCGQKRNVVADLQLTLLMTACECQTKMPRVALFGSQLGLADKDNAPALDVRDTDFILQVIANLTHQGEIVGPGTHPVAAGTDDKTAAAVAHKKKAAKLAVTQMATYRPDIPRTLALHTVKDIFCNWLADGGEDYLMKVRAMPHTERGARYVDVDTFIDILMEPWHTVRHNWEEHARFLFLEYCSVHKVLQDATFANDEGMRATDSVLVCL